VEELLLQRPRRGLLDAAFDLITHTLGIQRLPWIDDAPDLDEADRT